MMEAGWLLEEKCKLFKLFRVAVITTFILFLCTDVRAEEANDGGNIKEDILKELSGSTIIDITSVTPVGLSTLDNDNINLNDGDINNIDSDIPVCIPENTINGIKYPSKAILTSSYTADMNWFKLKTDRDEEIQNVSYKIRYQKLSESAKSVTSNYPTITLTNLDDDSTYHVEVTSENDPNKIVTCFFFNTSIGLPKINVSLNTSIPLHLFVSSDNSTGHIRMYCHDEQLPKFHAEPRQVNSNSILFYSSDYNSQNQVNCPLIPGLQEVCLQDYLQLNVNSSRDSQLECHNITIKDYESVSNFEVVSKTTNSITLQFQPIDINILKTLKQWWSLKEQMFPLEPKIIYKLSCNIIGQNHINNPHLLWNIIISNILDYEDFSSNDYNQIITKHNYTNNIITKTIKRLRDYTDYSCCIQYKLKHLIGYSNKTCLNQTTDQKRSNQVENLNLGPRQSDTSLIFSWNSPRNPSHYPIVNAYNITWRENETLKDFFLLKNDNEYSLDELLPYIEYNVCITPITQAGNGIECCKKWISGVKIPDAPVNITITYDRLKNLTLLWSKPERDIVEVVRYIVNIQCIHTELCNCWRYPPCLNNTLSTTSRNISFEVKGGQNYQFSVRAENDHGSGEFSLLSEIYKTPSVVPKSPRVHCLQNQRQLTLNWLLPTCSSPTEVTYEMSPVTKPGSNPIIAKIDQIDCKFITTPILVKTFTKYTWSLSRTNPQHCFDDIHEECSRSIYDGDCTSNPEVPSIPNNFTMSQHTFGEIKLARLQISWTMPLVINGILKGFVLKLDLINKKLELKIFCVNEGESTNGKDGCICINDKCNYTTKPILQPNCTYSVSFYGVTEGARGVPNSVSRQFSTEHSIPQIDPRRNWGVFLEMEIGMKPYEQIILDIYTSYRDNVAGKVKKMYLILSEENEMEEPMNGLVGNTTVQGFYNTSEYGTIRPYSIPLNNKGKVFRFTLGALKRKHCLSDHRLDNETYCNGQLRPSTNYWMKLNYENNVGFAESQIIRFRTSGPQGNGILRAMTVITISIIIAAIIFFYTEHYILICYHSRPDLDLELTIDKDVDPKRPILLTNLEEEMSDLKALCNTNLLSEFRHLRDFSDAKSTNSAQERENVNKNRYMNILPFDETRVRLSIVDGISHSNYINASFINGITEKCRFIATQGPTKNTISDFWRMVWEQRSRTIVMLTKCFEDNKEKCHEYWPYGDKTSPIMTIEGLTIELDREDDHSMAGYMVRNFTLVMGRWRRPVKLFHFTTWPDMGCPNTPDELINFVIKVKISDNSHQKIMNPIIVHCSAGVGRTGTFIGVYNMMEEMEQSATEIDVFYTTLRMRHHRDNMIQRPEQYVFMYECVLKYYNILQGKSELSITDEICEDVTETKVFAASKSDSTVAPLSLRPTFFNDEDHCENMDEEYDDEVEDGDDVCNTKNTIA